MSNVGTAYLQIMPSTKGFAGSLSSAIDGEATSAGKSAGLNIVGALKGVIAAAGIGAFFKEALDAGADLQQSFGGLDTIYGDASDGMKKMAYEAAQAGISANDYAEQAVGLGAALKKAFEYDTKTPAEAQLMAAKQADKVIMDMQDNAAKMGTDIGAIQNAYAGFAKQNYTMLDNLKLGYGGTKEEMERLLEDATKLSGIEYNINNLADVTDAIHVMQEEMGLAGVAAQEGAETFSGSMSAMKASAKNLLANLSLGEDIKEPLSALAENTKNFLVGNLFPMIGNILKQLPGLIGEGLMWAFNNIPNAVEGIINFINKLTSGLQENSGVFKEKLIEIGHAAMEMFKNIDWKGLGSAIINFLWTGIQVVGPIIWEALKKIGLTAYDWFKGVDWLQLGKDLLTLIWEGLQTLGSIIWEKLKEIGQAAADWFKEVDWIQVGKDTIKLIWEGLGAVGSWIWEKLKLLGSAAVEKFKEVDWIQLGKDTIKFIWEGLGAIGNWIWEKLKAIGSAAVEKMKEVDWKQLGKDVIKFIWEGLGAIGHWIWEKLKALGDAAVEKFKEIDWLQLGKDVITFIWNGLSNLGHTIWEKLKGIGEDAVEKFKEIDWVQLGKDVINLIWDGITNVGGWFADGFKWLGEKLHMDFLDGADGYGTGVEAAEEIGSGIEAGGWHTSSAMSNAAYNAYSQWYGYDWYGIGSGAMSGIESGVISYAYSLYNSLSNVAYNMWNTMRSYMQIGSPSKLMRDKIGKWIPLGIAEGINDEADSVTEAMMSMVDDAVNSTEADFSNISYGATLDTSQDESIANGGIVVNVYGTEGMNVRELADEVINRITFLQRQNQAAWGTA